jgi:hypothetical protein
MRFPPLTPARRREAPTAPAPVSVPGSPTPSLERTGRSLGRFAKEQARSRYHGAPDGEPHVARQLQVLRSQLTQTFRRDEALRSAELAARAATGALAAATDALATLRERNEPRIAAGVGISSSTADESERARWTDAQQAIAQIARSQRSLDAARAAEAEAERAASAAEVRAIDRLLDQAATGLLPINAYLAAFDQARQRQARPQLGLLGEETVHALVRDAVRAFHDRAIA